jgi:hypothetical protein
LPQNVLLAFTFVAILEVRNKNVNVLMNIPVLPLVVKTHAYQITWAEAVKVLLEGDQDTVEVVELETRSGGGYFLQTWLKYEECCDRSSFKVIRLRPFCFCISAFKTDKEI